jgi:peptidylprolyl isomerase domain and WD repeat-containing protein 1
LIGSGGLSSQGDKVLDPTIFAVAYKKNRFYLFSKREPAELEEGKNLAKRDVLNEKPTKDEIQLYTQPAAANLAKLVILFIII